MIYIRANNINFRYPNQTENLLENINFVISDKSHIGLIGKNGSSKTTIFKLLSNELNLNQGSYYINSGTKIGYLKQEQEFDNDITVKNYLWSTEPELYKLKVKMERLNNYKETEIIKILSAFEEKGGYEYENKMLKKLSLFDFQPDFLDKNFNKISGGEKIKIALCSVLMKEPNLLLLDEPTNHQDNQTLNWLENYLNNCMIPFIVISHDREFLDNCVTEIWELDKKTLHTYSGNYSFYKKEKNEKMKLKMHRYQTQKRKIKKLKQAYNERKNWALTHQAQTGSDGYAPVYESVSNSARKAMKKAKNIQTRLEKNIEAEEAKKPFIEKKYKVRIKNPILKNNYILRVENLSKKFGNKNLFKQLSFALTNNSKLSIKGKNGSGKSSLLKILSGRINDYKGSVQWTPQAKIGYYSQEFENLNLNNTIINEVLTNKYENQTKARTILGCFYLSGNKVHSKIKSLSIGERSKVALAKILNSNANVLILDEPTNHLDIYAAEAIEKSLQKFRGAVIFVTHDRYFEKKIANHNLNLEDYQN